ncbi:HEAT repeat domain-containing protein [Myxococcota bacterium]|nr:HEAT repeat domain-containing protein [Myxococcota bacterium]MBU1537821.1 HEAT repeat domain-containing protein [Myxococcota bacterium]
MKKYLITLTLLAFSLFMPARARADAVDVLVNTLKTSKNYKVRVTAAMLLSSHKGKSKAFSALLNALNNDKNPTVRGTAALSLGKLGNTAAIPYLKKKAAKEKSYVRKMAKEALKLLQQRCPSVNFSGKKIYLRVGPMGVNGFSSGSTAIKASLRSMLTDEAEKISYVTPHWDKCKIPKKRDLRKKKLTGFMVDGTLIISQSGSEVSCNLKIFITTFPGKAIKMMTSGGAALTGNLDVGTVKSCMEAVVPVVFRGVKSYLARNM